MPHLQGWFLLTIVIALHDLGKREKTRAAARELHASTEMMASLTDEYRQWIVDLVAYYDQSEQEPQP